MATDKGLTVTKLVESIDKVPPDVLKHALFMAFPDRPEKYRNRTRAKKTALEYIENRIAQVKARRGLRVSALVVAAAVFFDLLFPVVRQVASGDSFSAALKQVIRGEARDTVVGDKSSKRQAFVDILYILGLSGLGVSKIYQKYLQYTV